MRRPLPLALALLAALPVVAAQESFTAQAAATAIVHCGHLFDSESGKMLGETSITVQGDRIKAVQAGAPQAGSKVIELGNTTCLPCRA